MHHESSTRSGSIRSATGERLSDRVDAVIGEIAALLDERRADKVVRAREVLASTYQRASERRRVRRQSPGQQTAPIQYS